MRALHLALIDGGGGGGQFNDNLDKRANGRANATITREGSSAAGNGEAPGAHACKGNAMRYVYREGEGEGEEGSTLTCRQSQIIDS